MLVYAADAFLLLIVFEFASFLSCFVFIVTVRWLCWWPVSRSPRYVARPAFLEAFLFNFYVLMELFLTCYLLVIYYEIDIVDGNSGFGTSWDSQDGALIY